MTKTTNFTLRLPPHLAALLAKTAEQQRVSKSQFIQDAIAEKLGIAEREPNAPVATWLAHVVHVDNDEPCDECGEEINRTGQVFVMLLNDGTHVLVCGVCATGWN